jgi:hypothetical protein
MCPLVTSKPKAKIRPPRHKGKRILLYCRNQGWRESEVLGCACDKEFGSAIAVHNQTTVSETRQTILFPIIFEVST